jgi:hypothetical protein
MIIPLRVEWFLMHGLLFRETTKYSKRSKNRCFDSQETDRVSYNGDIHFQISEGIYLIDLDEELV